MNNRASVEFGGSQLGAMNMDDRWEKRWAPHINRDNLERVRDVARLVPEERKSLLEVGARLGIITELVAERFENVVALDLAQPEIAIKNVQAVAGDVTRLEYPDNSFDVVVCAEVLEHIKPEHLQTACDEITRVARHEVVIGVPYRQDTRSGRTTCRHCGTSNPPYGHLNEFDEQRLIGLFHKLAPVEVKLLGPPERRTNALSTLFMDMAGNPWGTYNQLEPCIQCGRTLREPQQINLPQKLCVKVAILANKIQHLASPQYPAWMHALFRKTHT